MPNAGYVLGPVGLAGLIFATTGWVALAVTAGVAIPATRPDRADAMKAAEQPG